MNNSRRITSLDRLLAVAHVGPEAGTGLDEYKENVAELLEALEDHGLAYGGEPTGALTLKIKFKRLRRGGIEFFVEQTVTHPKRPAAGGAAFVDDGQLSLDDPNVSDRVFKDVAPVDAEFKTPTAAE